MRAEELLRQLIAVKSPYFHEDEVMDFVNEWLKDRGVPAQIHTFFEPKETKFHGKNVIGIMDSGKPFTSVPKASAKAVAMRMAE